MATLLLSTLVLSLSSPLVTLAETINPETSLTMATASTESSSEAEKQEKHNLQIQKLLHLQPKEVSQQKNRDWYDRDIIKQ